MKLKEKDVIRLIFVFFIIIGFIILIWNFNKTIVEGNTPMSNSCNECRITPEYSPTATTSSYGLQNANSVIDANASTNPQYSLTGEQLLENYFGSALQGNNCINLDFSGVDGSYIFCPWQLGNFDKNCPSNTVVGGNTNTAFCCSNTSFYNNNYLLLNDVSRIYGLVFEVEDLSSMKTTTQDKQNMFASGNISRDDTYSTQSIYQFNPSSLSQSKTYTLNGFDTSINITQNGRHSSKPITQSFSGTDGETAITDKYINCYGQDISSDYMNSLADIPKACQELFFIKVYGKRTIGDAYNFCLQNPQFCELSNVMTDCKLLLPKYSPNEWYRLSQNQNVNASSDADFDITGSIQAGLQTAVDQLVSKFTEQITNLTSQIGDSLQFPNLGEVQYLDVGSCNNNSPYVYNSGCDTSLGYLGQYTCYPSLTGAFSDCGPPGYDPKPQF